MKSEQCSETVEPHDPHSWATIPSAWGDDELFHDRYCKGVESPVPSIIRLHRLIGRPYKLSSMVTGRWALTEAEYLVRNLKKQLRTRDRKITKLTRENRDLRKQVDIMNGSAGRWFS